MRKDWKLIYKILAGTMFLKYIVKTLTNHLKLFLAQLTITDRHAPLQKMSLKEHKLKLMPWITKGILTSVNNKNKTYRKYCRAKDQNRTHELHTLFKQY